MNPELFKKRLISFYTYWRAYKKELWGNSDVLVIRTMPYDSLRHSRHETSFRFLFWLTGYELSDTIAIFAMNYIHFFCNKEWDYNLRMLNLHARQAFNVPVMVHMKDNCDNGLDKMDNMLRPAGPVKLAMAKSNITRPLIIGYIEGECPKSRLLLCCREKWKSTEYQSAIANGGFTKLLNGKGENKEYLINSIHDRDFAYPPPSNYSACRFDSQVRCLDEAFKQMLSLKSEDIAKANKLSIDEKANKCILAVDCAAKKSSLLKTSRQGHVQMQNLPKCVEQMLSLENEGMAKTENMLSRQVEGSKQSLEEEKGNQSSLIKDDNAEKSMPLEIGDSSNSCAASNPEDDDWVVIEDIDQVQQMEKVKSNGWRRWTRQFQWEKAKEM